MNEPADNPSDATATDESDARYLAVVARDARFDGCFFTGVTSTGIYCRPVCSARTPRRENCQFFEHHAQAEAAGFRPCLRCRPELSPRSPSLQGSQGLPWSTQDASTVLARQAAQLMDDPQIWAPADASNESGSGLPAFSVARLAARLGVTDRHVRRIFEKEWGVSPVQYLQTRRLLTAKQLLTDTALLVTQVALISGYASVRRFNAAFVSHYGLNPSQLRREGVPASGKTSRIRLGYRPPYDAQAMLAFLQTRLLSGVESASDRDGQTMYARTLQLSSGGQCFKGYLQAAFDVQAHQLMLQVSDSLREVLPLVIRRVRDAFDLDASPHAINPVLEPSFPGTGGVRVPGTLCGFELAVRAVMGQQITVAAGRTLTQRLVNTFGEAIQTPFPHLDRLFPTPAALAAASGDALGQLGIVKQRQAAIVALAQAVASGQLQLHSGVDVQATITRLKTLPGIGDWTAQYIAMRALRWPDAFPAGDVALQKALGVHTSATKRLSPVQAAKAAELASCAWRPWRSYAVIRAWNGAWAAAPEDKLTDKQDPPSGTKDAS